MPKPSGARMVGAKPYRPSGVGRSAPMRALRVVAAIVLKRPGLFATAVAVLGVGGAIGWNATTQASRHPAPLFGARPALAAASPQPAAIEPPRRPDVAMLAAAAAVPRPVPRPENTISMPEPQRTNSTSDPIGNLIRTGEPGPKPSDPKVDPQRVSSVQRALTKLGYGPLRPDGVMGTTTRQAVERFERDQNLPVTGTLAARTTRQLATRAGTEIE